jgi:hypothetical protein
MDSCTTDLRSPCSKKVEAEWLGRSRSLTIKIGG